MKPALLPTGADGRRKGRRNGRRRGGGLFGFVKGVVGFVGVSVLSGAAMVLGAAAVNTVSIGAVGATPCKGLRFWRRVWWLLLVFMVCFQ